MPWVRTLVFLSISIAIFAIPFSPQRHRGTENCENLRNAKNNEGNWARSVFLIACLAPCGELIRSQAFVCVLCGQLVTSQRPPPFARLPPCCRRVCSANRNPPGTF